MKADVFTLFPQWFEWFRAQRHVENALALGHELTMVDPRATTPLKWGQVDDTPFGGGAGMVLRVDVMEAALRARYDIDPVDLPDTRRVIALTPAGRLLDDALASELAAEEDITLLGGRYEGFDERILEHFCTDRVSIGRYVLAGGELAAMVLLDAVFRKLPGALRSTPTTPVPWSGTATTCRTSCCPATTPGSTPGGGPRAPSGCARGTSVKACERGPDRGGPFATIAPRATGPSGRRAFFMS